MLGISRMNFRKQFYCRKKVLGKHILVNHVAHRAGQVGLSVAAQDSHIAEQLGQAVVSQSAEEADFALIFAVLLQIIIACAVSAEISQVVKCCIRHTDNLVVLVPHFVESPETVHIYETFTDINQVCLVVVAA